MNQAQWQVLQTMGIQAWQPVAAGEQRQPIGVASAPTSPAKFLIVAASDDVQAQRRLLQSIIQAVNWRLSDYLLVDNVTVLTPTQLATIECVWWSATATQTELFAATTCHIESASLSELAQNRQQKGALWSQLKDWHQPA
ncbi:DNA polymerase III subunit psi [Neiella marina]|uniref:DNA polymerase III subunit psi n=1 Tax=Neiella holothuriorum TaxID=2870530 RepID=A0ABS7EDX9_9GAMM|nr:DNA polymerase III subunit psi [Neiella holothuriorum]MBW8190539.1 DNA polymerase III subunit psi [Neiella holothuriorum]